MQVENANKALKSKNITKLEEILDEFITLLKNSNADWKDRVAICFILEQMAAIDPLSQKIIQSLINVLSDEKDAHVKEFAVWALGKIVQTSESLELIRKTMPVIIKFLNDDSEQVKTLATDFHSQFSVYLKEKEGIDQQIQHSRSDLKDLIEKKLQVMKDRGDEISKDALNLGYKAASDRQDEMKNRIKKFNEDNQKEENEILALDQKLINQIPAFKGESADLIRYWREKRGEKEDLIRRIECIIRIQSKIFNIIQFIMSVKPDEKIDLSKITDITKATGRPYTEKEVIEILQQLVDEEIVPNFMLNQIKDYQIKKETIEEKDKESSKED
jgi:hypothetical protein